MERRRQTKAKRAALRLSKTGLRHLKPKRRKTSVRLRWSLQTAVKCKAKRVLRIRKQVYGGGKIPQTERLQTKI